jgi:short subunit dehydrogenase-like uncharacterized protein
VLDAINKHDGNVVVPCVEEFSVIEDVVPHDLNVSQLSDYAVNDGIGIITQVTAGLSHDVNSNQ